MTRFSKVFLLMLSMSLAGCAVTSGLQTHDLPVSGTYQTELGTLVNIVPINQHNIPDIQKTTTVNPVLSQNLAPLFKQHQQIIYTLKPYDTLSINLWAYPEITPPPPAVSNADAAKSTGYQIDAQGYIQVPLVGRYKASGKTVETITKELRAQFARYLKQPDVIVRVLSYESQYYSVQGNVSRAGQFYLNNQPISVYTALGLAGGITDKGDSTNIQLIRNGITYSLNPLEIEKLGFSLHKLLLQANDTIYVTAKENQKIYIMGESGKNQALNLRDQGMTLSDALGESLGINPLSASAQRIYVLRSDQKTQETNLYVMDLSNLGNFGLANQFAMQRNDIIYVDASGLARWQRVVNQIIPFSSMLNGIQNLTTN